MRCSAPSRPTRAAQTNGLPARCGFPARRAEARFLGEPGGAGGGRNALIQIAPKRRP